MPPQLLVAAIGLVVDRRPMPVLATADRRGAAGPRSQSAGGQARRALPASIDRGRTCGRESRRRAAPMEGVRPASTLSATLIVDENLRIGFEDCDGSGWLTVCSGPGSLGVAPKRGARAIGRCRHGPGSRKIDRRQGPVTLLPQR